MTMADILLEARDRLGDTGKPQLWSDRELCGYTNIVINEVTEEKRLFRDSKTPAICNIAVLAADAAPDYLLDTRINEIVSARMNSQVIPLVRETKKYLESWNPDWRNMTVDTPYWFLTDYSEGYLTLVPKSQRNDTILLTVYRLPLTQMAIDAAGLAASPEIHFKHHPRLVNGIMSLAYLKDDTQCLDPQKAEQHRQLWLKDKDKMAKSRINLHDAGEFLGPNYGAI